MYSVILLFTGGIIILFIYMLTLVSSIKVIFFKASRKFSIFITCIILTFFLTPNELNIDLNLSNMFILRATSYTIFLAAYLFIVLMTVVKLSSAYKGAIKSTLHHEKK